MENESCACPPTLQPITLASLKEVWSQTYNTDGLPDWSHIYPYYDDAIVFQDSIQRVEGIEAFKGVCQRLAKRCTSLRMDITHVSQADNVFVMEWTMTMSFRKSPDTPLYGCTKLTLNEEGKIISQRDYYDLWGDIFNGIPRFNKMYRKWMHRYFG
ncbi:MAG: nuclear transport factor 2 family protein [Erysipelotrichaceae bacterium]